MYRKLKGSYKEVKGKLKDICPATPTSAEGVMSLSLGARVMSLSLGARVMSLSLGARVMSL
jgi:hypothetical protein